MRMKQALSLIKSDPELDRNVTILIRGAWIFGFVWGCLFLATLLWIVNAKGKI